MSLRGNSSSQSSGLTPRVSQIYLNYKRIENQLRAIQDLLMVERELNRATRDISYLLFPL
jgi:hypothetical protein